MRRLSCLEELVWRVRLRCWCGAYGLGAGAQDVLVRPTACTAHAVPSRPTPSHASDTEQRACRVHARSTTTKQEACFSFEERRVSFPDVSAQLSGPAPLQHPRRNLASDSHCDERCLRASHHPAPLTAHPSGTTALRNCMRYAQLEPGPSREPCATRETPAVVVSTWPCCRSADGGCAHRSCLHFAPKCSTTRSVIGPATRAPTCSATLTATRFAT